MMQFKPKSAGLVIAVTNGPNCHAHTLSSSFHKSQPDGTLSMDKLNEWDKNDNTPFIMTVIKNRMKLENLCRPNGGKEEK